MVWIHGGAWQFGSAEMQNGAALAKCGDVIVVALSYRLGVFGFLFGNWGLWDQIEGLKWVQVRNPRTSCFLIRVRWRPYPYEMLKT